MISYVIGVLLLIKHLKDAYPDVTQLLYSEKFRELGKFDNLDRYFSSLKRNGLDQGYYPRRIKIIMIVHPDNI